MTACERRAREARRRRELLRKYEQLRKEGLFAGCAAELLRTSQATLWRWRQRFNELGLPGLEPRTGLCGRRSQAKAWAVDEGIVRRVQLLNFALGGAEKAWRVFATSAACPPKLARVIRRLKKLPEGLLAIVRLRRRDTTAIEGDGFVVVGLDTGRRLNAPRTVSSVSGRVGEKIAEPGTIAANGRGFSEGIAEDKSHG